MKNAEEACREGLASGAVSLQTDSCPVLCISVEAEALPAQHLFVLRVRDTGSGMLPLRLNSRCRNVSSIELKSCFRWLGSNYCGLCEKNKYAKFPIYNKLETKLCFKA